MSLEERFSMELAALEKLFGEEYVKARLGRLQEIYDYTEGKWREYVTWLGNGPVNYLLIAEAPPWSDTGGQQPDWVCHAASRESASGGSMIPERTYPGYDELVPAAIRQRFPTVNSALDELAVNPSNSEAAAVVFWQLCYQPELWAGLEERLQSLVKEIEPPREVDVFPYWQRDAVFNDLRVAVEAILRPMLFDRFASWIGGDGWIQAGGGISPEDRDAHNEIVARLSKAAGHEPGLGDLLAVLWCDLRFLERFLQSLGLGGRDVIFVGDKLYSELDWLNAVRNRAEHPSQVAVGSGASHRAEAARDAVSTFLGIDCHGVLPHLPPYQTKASAGRQLNASTAADAVDDLAAGHCHRVTR